MKTETVRAKIRTILLRKARVANITKRVISVTEIAKKVGCSRPTAVLVLESFRELEYLDRRPRGKFIVRTTEERDRIIASTGPWKLAKALIAELKAEGVQATHGPRNGLVSVPASYVYALRAR